MSDLCCIVIYMTSTENLQAHRIATFRSWPQDPATFWNVEAFINFMSGGICNRTTAEAVKDAKFEAKIAAKIAAHNARPASERSGWKPTARRTQACHSRVNRMTGEVEFD